MPPPRADLSQLHSKAFAIYGLCQFFYAADGMFHEIYDGYDNLTTFDRQYIQGMPTNTLARRPLDWLTHLDSSDPFVKKLGVFATAVLRRLKESLQVAF